VLREALLEKLLLVAGHWALLKRILHFSGVQTDNHNSHRKRSHFFLQRPSSVLTNFHSSTGSLSRRIAVQAGLDKKHMRPYLKK
jgi:hypothetical protein